MKEEGAPIIHDEESCALKTFYRCNINNVSADLKAVQRIDGSPPRLKPPADTNMAAVIFLNYYFPTP